MYTHKISTTLFAILASLPIGIVLADTPAAEHIEGLAQAARQTTDTFMQRSFNLRMGYEYNGEFLDPNDGYNLCRLAETAVNELLDIAEKQKKLTQQIEDYQGDDWDSRYGTTGLWRKLSYDLYVTDLAKCEIHLYRAFASDQPQRNEILHSVLAQLNALGRIHDTPALQLLKAKSLSLLARTDPAHKLPAIELLNSLTSRSDVPQAVYFRAVIEKIGLTGRAKTEQLNALAGKLAQSNCADDFELVLSLAFLQRRRKLSKGFEKTVSLWPQTKDLLGSLILMDLSHRLSQAQSAQQNLQQVSVFEAELAAQAAWGNDTQGHARLLGHLSSTEKFQTPLIMYAAATAFADSSPARAVTLLINASRLRQEQRNSPLKVEANEIAKQSAQLAYNLLTEDSNNCPLALEAFENYSQLTKGDIDQELKYLHTVVLSSCGQAPRSKELLRKIADDPASAWRNQARLDLILHAVRQSHLPADTDSALPAQLQALIDDCTGQSEQQIRTKAITIYCQLLLEPKRHSYAQQVLNILSQNEPIEDPNLIVLKSKALRQLGRLSESAHCLSTALGPALCQYAGEAMELVSAVLDRIDNYEAQRNKTGSTKIVVDCKRLADTCYRCFRDAERRRAALYLAELTIFAVSKNQEQLSKTEDLLNTHAAERGPADIDALRCRARLLTKLGKFNKAAVLWAQIATIRKSESPSPGRRTWKWWRAKFYELYCWSKCPQTKRENVAHTIDVLENSFTDIPSLWAAKLNSLKEEIE